MKMTNERFATIMRACEMYRSGMLEIAGEEAEKGDIEMSSRAAEQARLAESGMAVLCHRFPMQVKQTGLSSWRNSALFEGGENDGNEGGRHARAD